MQYKEIFFILVIADRGVIVYVLSYHVDVTLVASVCAAAHHARCHGWHELYPAVIIAVSRKNPS